MYMETFVKLRISELDNSFIERIKALYAGKEDTVLTIAIGDSAESYWDILNRSKDDLENKRNLISFTMEELEAYAQSKKP